MAAGSSFSLGPSGALRNANVSILRSPGRWTSIGLEEVAVFSPGDPTQGPEFCMMPSIIGPEGGALPVVDCPIRHGRPPRLSRSHHRRALSVQSSDALFRSPSALFDRLSNERSRKPTQRRATQSIRHLYAAMRLSSNAILWTTTTSSLLNDSHGSRRKRTSISALLVLFWRVLDEHCSRSATARRPAEFASHHASRSARRS